MNYYFDKIVDMQFEDAIQRVTEGLKKSGFGVLTEIDVQQTLKQKIGVDILPYRILGACNPHFAYKALQVENRIGAMLPCNVIVREIDGGQIEVAAVDPVASMQAVENEQLSEIAMDVRTALRSVIDEL